MGGSPPNRLRRDGAGSAFVRGPLESVFLRPTSTHPPPHGTARRVRTEDPGTAVAVPPATVPSRTAGGALRVGRPGSGDEFLGLRRNSRQHLAHPSHELIGGLARRKKKSSNVLHEGPPRSCRSRHECPQEKARDSYIAGFFGGRLASSRGVRGSRIRIFRRPRRRLEADASRLVFGLPFGPLLA